MQARALETLVRIAQVQSFSHAADLQNMTLSALSMQTKALEVEMGAALFDRSFRLPKLTPLGAAWLSRLRCSVNGALDFTIPGRRPSARSVIYSFAR